MLYFSVYAIKSGVDLLNCVRRCSVSTMGSNFNATATFSATSMLTGPLSAYF